MGKLAFARLTWERPPAPYELTLSDHVLVTLPDHLRSAILEAYAPAPITGSEAQASMDRTTAMLSNLDMPAAQLDWAGVVLGLAGVGFGAKWRQYSLDLAGIILWPPPEPDTLAPKRALGSGRNRPPIASYSGFPYWRKWIRTEWPDGSVTVEAIVLQIWRRVLRCDGVTLIVEGRWHPDKKEQISVHGLEKIAPGTYRSEVSLLLAGMPFFQQVAPGGRTEWSGIFRSKAEFLLMMRTVTTALKAVGKYPSAQTIAGYLSHPGDAGLVRFHGCSESALDYYRRKAGFRNWAELLSAVS